MFSPEKSAIIQINVHFKDMIDEHTLLSILHGEMDVGPWAGHLFSLIQDVHNNTLIKLFKKENLKLQYILDVYSQLPASYYVPCKEKLNGLVESFT